MATTKAAKHGDTVTTATPAAPVKVTASVPTAALPMGVPYSLHDCASVGQAGLHNMVWPINLAGTAAGTFNHGVTMICRDPTVTVNVSY